MRKALIVAGIVVALVIIAAGIFLATFDPNQYHDTIQAKLEQQLNRKVSLGKMSLGIFPIRFRVADVAIADDPSFGDKKPFVTAQELSVSVKLLPLLHKAVEIDTLTLQRPSVELIKNPKGVWNFASLGAAQQTAPENAAKAREEHKQTAPPGSTETPAPSNSEANQSQQFSLGELAISDGQVAITDEQNHQPRAVYDHIDLSLTDFAPDTPFDLDASVHLPGAGNQEVRLKGKGGPLAHEDPASTPFKGTLDLQAVQIGGLRQFLQTPALQNTDGAISGHTDIDSQNGNASAAGQMKVDNPRIHGIEVGYPINLDYDVSDDLKNDLLQIKKGNIKLGSTPLDVTGTVNSKPTPAQLDVNLKANDVSIAEISRLAAAAGMALSPNVTANGKLNANVQARGSADKPALNGTITGNDIQLTGKEIAKPVQVKAINVALTPTEIHSDPFNVTSGGTNAAVQFALKQYTSNSPQVDATVKAPQAALPDLLAMAKAYGVTSLDKISGAGNLNLDMHAAGPVKSLNSDQIMRALNGTMNLNFNSVHYAGVDISHQLASLAGLQHADQGFTNIAKMTGDILVKNGVAQTSNLQAVLDIANLGAVGTADLATQALNMEVTAVFSKQFAQGVAARAGGNLLNAALSNDQGELVIPAIVTGTFQNPKFFPDAKKLAQMKLKGLIPNSGNPLAGASGLLGGLLGQKGQQPANGQQQQQNPVNQLMGLFGKKKQK